MDATFASETGSGSTINPADLHQGIFDQNFFDAFCQSSDSSNLPDLPNVDSAVDLTAFLQPVQSVQSVQSIKMEPFEGLFEFGEASAISSTPSPSTGMIFSQANSPGDFVRDQSHTSTPETVNDINQDAKSQLTEEDWKTAFATPEAIHIPQTLDTPQVHLFPDKTKTRAETQIKVNLVLDPVHEKFDYIHFPRKTLAKPKQLTTPEEQKDYESSGEALHLDLLLVVATAVDKAGRLEQALRRARGDEKIPRRSSGIAISEIDKEDPAHPQNGGEILICEGCKERERKRYDRKKKKSDDEDEWWSYEDDRIIMINEKEYKKWKDVESGGEFSPHAKQVEFAMRIACYCRHQEEKNPVGYRVIFTFKDSQGHLVTQHTSDIFQITDDHKNKDPAAPETMTRSLHIPQTYVQHVQPQYPPPVQNVLPGYQYSMDSQYTHVSAMAQYPQTPNPVAPNFQMPMSPMESQFPQSTTSTRPLNRLQNRPPPLQTSQTFTGLPASTAPAAFSRHTPFDTPALSPTSQAPMEAYRIPRNLSLDNFNFTSPIQYSHQGFASAPQSTASTPINLSRPASPTWEQGPPSKRNLKYKCFYWWVEDGSDDTFEA